MKPTKKNHHQYNIYGVNLTMGGGGGIIDFTPFSNIYKSLVRITEKTTICVEPEQGTKIGEDDGRDDEIDEMGTKLGKPMVERGEEANLEDGD